MQLLELLLLRLVIAVVAVVVNGIVELMVLEHVHMTISSRIEGRVDLHSRGRHGPSMQQGMMFPAACITQRDVVALVFQMFLRKAAKAQFNFFQLLQSIVN